MTPNTPMTEFPVELEPCPFCGADAAKLCENPHANMAWVSCIVCGLEAPSETGVTAEQAIDYWNSRPISQSLRAPAGEAEPIHHTFARVAHKAAIRIRPDVSGDAEYWRLREAIQAELADSVPPLYAAPPSEGVKVTELADALGLVEQRFPGSFWHMAKGRITSNEPLFAFQVLFGTEEVLAEGQGNTEVEAILSALEPTT